MEFSIGREKNGQEEEAVRGISAFSKGGFFKAKQISLGIGTSISRCKTV